MRKNLCILLTFLMLCSSCKKESERNVNLNTLEGTWLLQNIQSGETVRGWFEQALVETIIGIQGLMNRKDWTQSNIDGALSQEALTTSVMQRYHVFNSVKRELGSKVGSLKNQISIVK